MERIQLESQQELKMNINLPDDFENEQMIQLPSGTQIKKDSKEIIDFDKVKVLFHWIYPKSKKKYKILQLC